MQTRYRAAATALLLTATAGLAATGGAAEASGTHATARTASSLVVTIHTHKGGGMTLSDSKIRPGNTIFKVAPHAKGSSGKQLLRLKAGYTEGQAFSDIGAAFGGDVHAVRRVDHNIVFYGGNQMNPRGGDPTYWAINLAKRGTYLVLDVDKNTLTQLKVAGPRQTRALPSQDGWINAATKADGVSNTFHAGKHNAASGWMSSTNKALEPHFFDVGQVKRSTTRSQVKACFNGGDCSFALSGHASAGVISPGKHMLWSYSLPKGHYLVDCFWPSKETGMPHAFMGMFRMFDLG